MNALFDSVHNFILPLVRGEDRVCACTCGSHKVYHIVAYDEAQSDLDSREIYILSDFMTPHEIDVIAGLLLGLCISWFLLWLNNVWDSGLEYWRANQMSETGFWSRMPKFNTWVLFRRLNPKHTKDSKGNMLDIKRDVYYDVNGSI